MVLKETALHEKAKELESKGLLKIQLNPSCLSALEELLDGIYVVSRPRPNDYDQRGDLVRVFNVMAKEVYGSRNDFPVVVAFGSFLMDNFSNKSDLDLSINFSNESAELSRKKKIKELRKFSKKLHRLQSKGHVSGVNPILSAKVPIVKVVDRGTGIECDISVENKDGIAKSQFVFIVSEIDERFQKLCTLMKAWAKAYGINSSKDQTLNSLSIILLVAFHLQTREPPILPPFSALLKDGTNPESVKKLVRDNLQYGKDNKESLGVLFTTLLSKLASVEALWPAGLCASPYEGSWISKTWNNKVNCISVEDFMDRSQNVSRAVAKEGFKVIYKCINSSLHHLSAFVEGRIDAPKLKVHLFGAEPTPPVVENTKNTKRSSLLSTSLDSVVTKKARATGGSSSWAPNQKYGATQNYPPRIPGFGHGFQNSSKGSWAPTPVPIMPNGGGQWNNRTWDSPGNHITPNGGGQWNNRAWDSPANPMMPNGGGQWNNRAWDSPAKPMMPNGGGQWNNRAWDSPANPSMPNGGEQWNIRAWDSPANPTMPNGGGQWNNRVWDSPANPTMPNGGGQWNNRAWNSPANPIVPNGGGQCNNRAWNSPANPIMPHGGGQWNDRAWDSPAGSIASNGGGQWNSVGPNSGWDFSAGPIMPNGGGQWNSVGFNRGWDSPAAPIPQNGHSWPAQKHHPKQDVPLYPYTHGLNPIIR